jgi:hypothetical protein
MEGAAHRMEKIFPSYTFDKGLVTRIYREFKKKKKKKLNSPKFSDLMKKWSKELNKAFSKEEVQMAKKKGRRNAQHSWP